MPNNHRRLQFLVLLLALATACNALPPDSQSKSTATEAPKSAERVGNAAGEKDSPTGTTAKPTNPKAAGTESTNETTFPKKADQRTGSQSFMEAANLKEATRAEAIKWWKYDELLLWDQPPPNYREFIALGTHGRDIVQVFYLPPGADPYRDSLQTLRDKGAFESSRWYAPPGDSGDDSLDRDEQWRAAGFEPDPNNPFPKGYKTITVRGEQAKMLESRTDCAKTQCDREWQSGSNRDVRRIIATRKHGPGLIQWVTETHWNRTPEEQIQITEALTPHKR